ncbi:Phage SPO1 DNA polymerase-related protein [Nitrosococcus oceani ATCC 19707]|uniref:Type-4 uracil-DNA glycosylase n=2 Tax=Nitrosococcus oceani TaxID=1229 RepID=Q3J878_NITOC|nr:uracil-DNA glycosylase [Nitrosococcus oceani]ABA58968.1 Phage SPO1 DNA polymerase-related protein [Nitrosococcus oceani ATCC 19707]EDZ65320.1 uracil-DNA glycosylase, family 4 [Nitrosococcus oceani AFC27]KFI18590.1 DNA polymerase [Nitrosococcus oceani C-27]GEM18936.1 uracil-DNA glycosylase [Nitrosococcus oceani]
MDSRQLHYLETMGIQVWQQRQPTSTGKKPLVETGEELIPLAPSAEVASEWEELAVQVASCTACLLHCGRTQTVFGVGDQAAKWLIVGEAPGVEEDRQGEPFVGRAGQLLNAMLEAVGLQRGQVYIANILKCRPPNNRDPLPEEVAHCEPYLRRQVALLRPRIILAVGRVAGQNLLKSSLPLGRLRGSVHQYPETTIPLVVTYHPAYLLRAPREKRRAWQDLQLAHKVYREF